MVVTYPNVLRDALERAQHGPITKNGSSTSPMLSAPSMLLLLMPSSA